MGPLSFFATGNGVLLLGILAALVVLLWDWRAGLALLFVEQLGIAALAVGVEGAPAQMMLIQTFVIGLSCLMLATSGMQVHLGRSGRQSGGWFFRLLVLGLLAAALTSLDLGFVLPEVSPAIARLFGWLGLIALLMLSLGDHALFTAVALLLWCVLGYAVAAFYAPVAEVMVVIGLVELAVALACSYLILAERLPMQQQPIATDSGGAAVAPGPAAKGGTPLTRKPAPNATQTMAAVPAAGAGASPAARPAVGASPPPPSAGVSPAQPGAGVSQAPNAGASQAPPGAGVAPAQPRAKQGDA